MHRHQIVLKVMLATVLLVTVVMICLLYSFSRAFEQAKKAPGCVFGTRGEIDIGRIKQSKYFRALLQQSNIKAENELVLCSLPICVYIWI